MRRYSTTSVLYPLRMLQDECVCVCMYMYKAGRESLLCIPTTTKLGLHTTVFILFNDFVRQFLMPGFVDTHIHAPQYVFTGTAMGIPLIQWLNKYTFRTEMKFADVEFATDVYHKVVRRTLKNGTTTASYYATIHRESSLKLAEIAAFHGQRAFVGKVNMDLNSTDYVETTEKSIEDTEWFIQQVQSMNNPLIVPIVTPRFAPSCSETLMKKLAEIANRHGLPIQTHIAENTGEIALVKKTFPESKSYTDLYRSCGLLTEKTILAHCIYLADSEVDILKTHKCGISHCANSNFTLKSGVMDLRKVWDEDLKVGLGTDVAGGYSPSVMNCVRNSVIATNVQAIQHGEDYKSLNYKEMFYLATLGGSKVMGIEDKIGNFEVGKEFDALLIDPLASNSPFDVFDSAYVDSLEDIVQKFLFLGDDRNIMEVYVAGRKVVPE